ncbi:MAG: NupC/NupG family nucleoside CNT transporter [Spirochaetota bacterium]|nr:NupC/NupG family nucleoside CNT transporter [Spirochaetota bacterium]
MERFMSVIGCFTIIGVAYLLSNSKKSINWKLVLWGLLIQLVIGILVIPDSFFNTWIKDIFNVSISPGQWFFNNMNDIIMKILSFSDIGMNFLLGSFIEKGKVSPVFENFMFRGLPIIIFFSSLIAILYHYKIMQKIVNCFAFIMRKFMGTSGAESLAVSSNIFVGMIEAPLTIRPFISQMTQSELFSVMVAGMATIAGSVMGVYVGMLESHFPNIAGHLLTASLMSAPAALVLSKIMIPELDQPVTLGQKVDVPVTTVNGIDALSSGAIDGLKLVFNVGAVLLVFIALLNLIDFIIVKPQTYFNITQPINIQSIAGYIFAPISFLLGVPSEDVLTAGTLLGEKVVLNELIAYNHLGNILKDYDSQVYNPLLKALQGDNWEVYAPLTNILKENNLLLTERSKLILSYALCGFANFGSIGIMIGGISGMIPNRAKDLAKLGFKSMLGGLLAGFLTACIAGIIV